MLIVPKMLLVLGQYRQFVIDMSSKFFTRNIDIDISAMKCDDYNRATVKLLFDFIKS